MLLNKIKKLVGVTALVFMAGLGIMNGGQAVKAQENSVQVSEASPALIDDLIVLWEEEFGYRPYSPYAETVNDVKELVNYGIVDEEEGNLQIKFLEATTEDEKEAVYKEIVNYLHKLEFLTDQEFEKLKLGSYKDYFRILDEFYYDEMVSLGYMTKKDAELEFSYNSAKDSNERQAVYVKMVDYRLEQGEITQQQADKLKADGYEKDAENMDEIDYEKTLNDLFNLGAITQEQKEELSKVSAEERWIDTNKIYSKLYIEEDVKNGVLTREEADLQIKLLETTDVQEMEKIYLQICEVMYERGELTGEEMQEIKQLF